MADLKWLILDADVKLLLDPPESLAPGQAREFDGRFHCQGSVRCEFIIGPNSLPPLLGG